MLYIFGGLPGTGKSTLASHLAKERQAVYLRIDTIEQELRDAGALEVGSEGYSLAYRIAGDNLRLGMPVVADSVNPIDVTRRAWRQVALTSGTPFVEIEVLCSDAEEHRSRIESRASDIEGLKLPTWADVLNREYDDWCDPLVIVDTAGQAVEESLATLRRALAS